MPGNSRIERLVAGQSAKIRAAFATFVASVKSPAVMAQVEALLSRYQIDEALKIVDSYITRMGRVIGDVQRTTGQLEVAALASQLSDLSIAISFDPGDPAAADIIRQSELSFIVGFTDEQRKTTRQAIAQALQEGAHVREAATAFRESIGLTLAQESAVSNYERLLRLGSAEALTRDLRDRRFDPTIRSAVAGDTPISSSQIDKMVGRYRERYLAYRADTIARTEGLSAVNTARDTAVKQVMRQTNLIPNNVERQWSAVNDARTRDTHAAMDGQIVGIDEPFQSPSGAQLMYPGDPSAPPEEIINCRCSVLYNVKAA